MTQLQVPEPPLELAPDEWIVRVALENPLPTLFDYRHRGEAIAVGQLVCVPFGRRRVVGLAWELVKDSDVPPAKLRRVAAVFSACAPLGEDWLGLIAFAAEYYQRGFGEVALPALPQALRDPAHWPRLYRARLRYRFRAGGEAALLDSLPARALGQRALARALADGGLADDVAQRLHGRAMALLTQWCERGWVECLREIPTSSQRPQTVSPAGLRSDAVTAAVAPAADPADGIISARAVPATQVDAPLPPLTLSAEQQTALLAITEARHFEAFLLFGITGSGKTEVYLRAMEALLARDPSAQILLLVPEINLTPQFEKQLRARFGAAGPDTVVTLHSGLPDGERARHWLAAHEGRARIVLGTRLSVLASLPALALIVVDEEHEAAYKQQEGLRYSARDLAVWRAKARGIAVVLGSATPSLESWSHAEQHRYTRLRLERRPQSSSAAPPDVRLIDLEAEKRRQRALLEGISQPLLAACAARLERGEQSLIFLNRRGYAPVLACDACGWVSGCPRCSAYLVLHKADRELRCHHCGYSERIPRACPDCGNVDVAPLGRGTQRVEATLAEALPGARVLRIDADSTRRRGSAAALFADVHAGEVDILVGTHMIAKGHDFQRVTLVGVLNADAALFSHDFRASERLFAQLTQVAGRAGRAGQAGEVLIQTRYPTHPLYAALARHDYAGFAAAMLEERRAAHLPPFTYQALLRAEARTLEAALAFLKAASFELDAVLPSDAVRRYDPVPMSMVKIADTFRAQMLVESRSRSALQMALHAWQPALRTQGGVLRWSLEVDPLEI